MLWHGQLARAKYKKNHQSSEELMILRTVLMAFFLLLSQWKLAADMPNNPVEFVVVVPSYNNEKWIQKNLDSIVNQTYQNWSIYYINDCSADKTRELVDGYIAEKGLGSKSKVVHNPERMHALANTYKAIHDIDPKKVVVILDGDDWFAHKQVLEKLAAIYANKDVWITYGDYKLDPIKVNGASCCKQFSEEVAKKRTFREHRWIYGPVRTFYAKLFHGIKKEDLLWKGNFFSMTGDVAFMFPMLEMASKGHIQYVPEIMYIYNVVNPINDHRIDNGLQLFFEEQIRSRTRYKALKELF